MNEDNNEDEKSQTVQVENLADTLDQKLNEKSTPLAQVANNTFKELCLTLEHEQAKLIELEQRRKKLQEEMQLLKLEIEEEKKAYRTDIELEDSFESVETMDSFSSSICEDDIQKQMSLQSGA